MRFSEERFYTIRMCNVRITKNITAESADTAATATNTVAVKTILRRK